MRRSDRIERDAAARLHPSDWSSLELRILDLSRGGFRAQCDALILVGSRIALEIPGIGTAEAHVSWRRNGRIGARFTRPIDPTRCGWSALEKEQVLARLLVRRAAARCAGMVQQEQTLRQQILASLPLCKVETPQDERSDAQEVVDRRLGPRPGVDALHDHGASK